MRINSVPCKQLLSKPLLATNVGQTLLVPATRELDDVDDFIDEEPPYQVLIHNDDVTPYDYVVDILQRIFALSEELADHVAWTAHHEDTAVVVVRPRAEADRLITLARAQARLDGYPLTFSMEPVA
jgi:ATP-dependent Clp protease adaptor protein ClpS